jgi:hypothetical protein
VELELTEVAEGVREKGDGMAVDRRNGFAEADETGGEEVVTFCNGGREGGWTETGRPPGVRALAMDDPGASVFRLPVGVLVLLL